MCLLGLLLSLWISPESPSLRLLCIKSAQKHLPCERRRKNEKRTYSVLSKPRLYVQCLVGVKSTRIWNVRQLCALRCCNEVPKAGVFEVMRRTKIIDGSRGGQAFMCNVLRLEPGRAYGIEEQARVQMLGVLLVAAGLTESDQYADFLRTAQDDFGLNPHLGVVFKRRMAFLLVANAIVLGFAISFCYMIWLHTAYGDAIPYLIRLCSIMSWASGSIGLVALGGNPRVTIDQSKPPPAHILARLEAIGDDFTTFEFGSLHGSAYIQDQSSCPVATDVVRTVKRRFLFAKALLLFHPPLSPSPSPLPSASPSPHRDATSLQPLTI